MNGEEHGIIQKTDEGGLGDLRTCSSSMKLMQSVVRVANNIAAEELSKMIRFAVSVRDNEECSARDRMRATELLASLMNKGIDVAQYIDKAERAAAGISTESATVRIVVEYQDQDQNGRAE